MCNSNQYGGMGETEISSIWKLLYNPKAGSSCSPDGEKEDITSDDNAPKIGKCLISWEEPDVDTQTI
jgi:hypothetical protein